MGYNERGDDMGFGKGDMHPSFRRHDMYNNFNKNNNGDGQGCMILVLIIGTGTLTTVLSLIA